MGKDDGCAHPRPPHPRPPIIPPQKGFFSPRAPAAETEEEAEAEVDSPEQERAKLAALLFADDNSLPENVKFETRGKTKHEPNNVPQGADLEAAEKHYDCHEEETRSRASARGCQATDSGACPEPSRRVPPTALKNAASRELVRTTVEEHGFQPCVQDQRKMRALAPEVVLPREEQVVDKNESVK